MTYLIWTVSFLVGVGLATQDGAVRYVGFAVIVAGALAGYVIGKRKDEDRAARKIADAMRDQ